MYWCLFTLVSLAKISDWNLFRDNQNYPDSFRFLNPSQCESSRTIPKNVLYLVLWKKVKNQSDLIRGINPNESEVGLIQTEFSIRIIPTSDSFGIIPRFGTEWIRFSRINFLPFFLSKVIQTVFQLVRKQILEWFGIVMIRSDWITIQNFLAVILYGFQYLLFRNTSRKFQIRINSESIRTIPIHFDICFQANANH